MPLARGFTLIEITVVVAIIAIIASAMFMTSTSLFGRSGSVALISNIHDLSAASREFKARYGYFPGDLPNANTAIPGATISADCIYAPGGTTGNGIVDTAAESTCALEHLVKAGLLRGIVQDPLTGVYSIVLNNWSTDARVSLWLDSTANVNAVRVTNLPCDVARELDGKLDSVTSAAAPFTDGSIRARDGANNPIAACAPGAANDPVATLLIRY